MRVLLVKTSSMGDVLHTLPALSDAKTAIPDIEFDWVVEEAFAEIPAWHPAVRRVIIVALRRWRRRPWSANYRLAWRAAKIELARPGYTWVIDAQSLLKSALLARCARAPIWGLDRASAREPLAAWLYHHTVRSDPAQHAITRIRELFAKTLKYEQPDSAPNYQLTNNAFPPPRVKPDLLFVCNASRAAKEWPENCWSTLCALSGQAGLSVALSWHQPREKERALRLAAEHPHVQLLPKMNLTEIAAVISATRAVVAVDTGLAHLSAALGRPTLALYLLKKPQLVGIVGARTRNLSSAEAEPTNVWRELKTLMSAG